MSYSDVLDFVEWALKDKWVAGAKAMLSSSAAYVAYSTATMAEQTNLVRIFLTMINSNVEDLKLRRTYSMCIVEDIFTMRPFTKHLAFVLLERREDVFIDWYDIIKLSRECLKNLTAEDLRQIHILAGNPTMAYFERTYNDINGGTVDNELSKIVLRYVKEGKP